MPAIVRSVEVSSGAGTSDAEGRRRWPRSSKKRRKVSRMSSAVTADSLGAVLGREARLDGPPPDHEVPVHEAGRLSRCDPVGGLGEIELEALVNARGHGPRH